MQRILRGSSDAATASAFDFPFQALMQQLQRVAEQLEQHLAGALTAAAGAPFYP